MKKSFIIFSLLFIGLTAYAQGGGQRGGQRGRAVVQMNPEEQAEKRAQMFQEQFGLSDDQYKKSYELFLTSAKEVNEKMKELRASGDRIGLREAMTKNREETDEKLKKILSATQWTAYEKWKKENPPMERRRGGGN